MWRLTLLLTLLREARDVWIALGVPLLFFLAIPLLPSSSAIRYGGLVLEVFGLLIVGYGLIEIRNQLNLPSVLDPIQGWFSRFRSLFQSRTRDIRAAAFGSSVSTSSGQLSSYKRYPVDFSKPVSDQIRALENSMTAVHERIDRVAGSVGQEQSKIRGEIASTREALERKQDRLGADLKQVSLGNPGREFVGLMFIAAGATFATLPDELYSLWASVV